MSDAYLISVEATKSSKALVWLFGGAWQKRLILLGLDLLGILLGFCVSYLVSTRVFSAGAKLTEYVSTFFIFALFLTMSLYLTKGYKPVEDRRSETELEITVKGITIAFLLAFAANFVLFKGKTFSRYVMVLWWVSSLIILPFFRFGLREVYKSLWRRGYLREKVLLIGSEDEASIIKEHLAIQRHDRFEYISPASSVRDSRQDGAKGWEKVEIQRMIDEYGVNRVFIIPDRLPYRNVSEISSYCRSKGVAVSIVSDDYSAVNQKISIDEFTGLLTLEASDGSPFSREWNRLLKRAVDVLVSIAGLAIVGMIYIVVGIANKMEDGGSVIFRRRVVGKNGKEFDAFKFRSMLMNADEVLEKNPELKREFERNYKLENDPRLTKVGALIRKYSIDELPQLANVLSGQMSLVGPRMKVREEIGKYYGQFSDKVLSVRPGITGFWQVNGRQTTNYDERVRMDMFYIDHWSIWMDIVIMIKTFWKVIKREGAL